MRTLLCKEWRELRTPVLAALACALLVGLLDVAYNWGEARFAGLSLAFCMAVAVLGSLFGGANAVARETTDQKAFLGSWPVSRRDLWLAKLVANLGAVVVVAVGAYLICGGLLALRGYDFSKTYLQITGLPLSDLAIFCLTLFAFAFSASWLATSALGAMGIAAGMLAAPTLVWTVLTLGGLPGRWGPWLGFHFGSLSPEQQSLFEALPFVLFSAAVIIAVRKALLHCPILDLRPRRRLTYRLFAALAALGVGVGCVGVVALMPRPTPSPTHSVTLTADGERLLLLSGPEETETSTRYDSLWALSTVGGQPRLVARGPVAAISPSPAGHQVLFAWGDPPKWGYGPQWLADLDAGRLWRTPPLVRSSEEGEAARWSPSGKSLLAYGYGALLLMSGNVAVPVRDIEANSRPFGWTADENGIFTVTSEKTSSSTEEGESAKPGRRPVWRTDLRTGRGAVVAQVSEDLELTAVSPDGRWLLGTRSVEEWLKAPWGQETDHLFRSFHPELQLVDTAHGAVHPFAQLTPCAVPFTPDGRYLWCRYQPRSVFGATPTEIRVIDLRTLRIAHTIPAPAPRIRQVATGNRAFTVYGREVPDVKAFAARSGRAYLREPYTPYGQRAPRGWIAEADGSDFRLAPAFVGEFAGLTGDGALVVWRKPAQFARIDPLTGAETLIWQP